MPHRLKAVLAMSPHVAEEALSARSRERLDAVAEVDHGLVVRNFADPAARAALAGAEVLLTGWGCPPVDEEVLDHAPALRAVVHSAGTVKDHLCAAVWRRGLIVSSAAQANAGPVAQFTLAMVLLGNKRAFRSARAYREGRYQDTGGPGVGNHDRTVGVIGASRIGRLVLSLLAGQGFRLLVADPTLDEAVARALVPGGRVEQADLDTLMASADVVTVHAPALPETHHLIDDRRLGLMRDGAVLINTARGALIDQEALVRHCSTGRIDAILDVTVPEPLPPDHPLFSLPNVLVTPHIAGAMGTEVQLLGEFAVGEVERLAAGLPLLGQVTEADLKLMA